MTNSESRVEVEFQLERAESLRALRRHLIRTGGLPWMAPATATLAVLSGAALLRAGWSATLSLGAFCGILLSAGLLGVYLAPYALVGPSPELAERCHFRFGDDGLFANVDDRAGRIPWDSYVRWTYDREFFFLYFEADRFTPVPRRVLSEEDERRLKRLFEKRIGYG